MRKFSGVLQHSGCRRRLAVNARAVCTFGARRACFVTAHKPLIPWHTSSWTAEYFKYSWHEVVAHWSGCAGRSHSQFRSSLVPDGRRIWKRSRRWTWHITTFTTQFYFEGHALSFFFFFLFFFNSYCASIPQAVPRPSNVILNEGISNLLYENETFTLLPTWISIVTYLYWKPIVNECFIPIYWFLKHSIKIYIVVHIINLGQDLWLIR